MDHKDWESEYPDGEVRLKRPKNDWKSFFELEIVEDEITKMNNILTACLKEKIVPCPRNVFRALKMTPLSEVRVVLLGQDPYFGPGQAMGLSFSVPEGMPIPSSLQNIYKNLLRFKHIKKMPTHGDLSNWAKQGCLLINTSLTTIEGETCSHMTSWRTLTTELIKYISNNTEGVVFLLFGSPALSKLELIDTEKHFVSISSHPSGLSNTKPLRTYGAFNDVDHFGFANAHLEIPIDWNP